MTPNQFDAQLIGYPRIGPARELKWALEQAWDGRLGRAEFDLRISELRGLHLEEQRGLIGSAVDDYFVYDEVLETALMFGILPDGLRAELETDPFGVVSALARGTRDREAWEMTKWFDTNYHYVVPEMDGPIGPFTPLPWRQPTGDPDVTWSVLGPYSLVKLSRLGAGNGSARDAAQAIGQSLWEWVSTQARTQPTFRLQLDEPSAGLSMSAEDRALLEAAYAGAPTLPDVAPRVTVQFGGASEATIEHLGGAGFAVQVPLSHLAALTATAAWAAQPEHLIAVMDGRSVWPDDFERARVVLTAIPGDGRPIRLVPSTSLMFLPVTVEGEEQLPPGFQFAREKARALAGWPAALEHGTALDIVEPPRQMWPALGELAARDPRPARRVAQDDLDLPDYPTTTTGSLPQTTEVRQLRRQLGRGELEPAAYDAAIGQLIADAIGWQERMGLDVLVHGEFERTDMVEYFAEQMDGYLTTRNGWVLSYGSRCTRPPILAAPPTINDPMTVHEWRLAQAATSKPVKGMLTGPVTIVNWSFRPPGVADDQLFWAVAQPIRQEVDFLVAAGARIIQVDEPAVRERWPLPTDDAPARRAVYARGVRAALNHVFNQPAHVQMHTHMCYGDFGEIVPLWSDAGVDVASIEFSRSKDDSYIRQFYELFGDGHLQIGPGVFDVHSPHSPGRETMDERLRHFESFMARADLWVNPDCGLKTRRWEEIEQQLGDMVAAARHRRAAAQVPA